MSEQELADGRTIEGIAVPYGVRVAIRPGLWETFAPGAFAESVRSWMSRGDGARLPIVSSHPGEGSRTVVGVAHELIDTPEGVRFKGRLLRSAAAREYGETVAEGANAVSVEFEQDPRTRVDRTGTLEHRVARLLAIAGAVAPAYDGARVAVRSIGGLEMTDPIRPEDEPEGTDATETPDEGEETGEESTAPAGAQARSRQASVAGRAVITDRERRSREASAVARMTGSAPVRITRSELVYTREGEHRFLRDGLRAASGDMEAMGRLHRHYGILEDVARRAVTSGDVAGAYPTEFLPGLLVERVLKGRPLGGFFRRIPVVDARPRTFPRVTTSTVVGKQATEGVNVAPTSFATEPVTTTPAMYMGSVDVARQVLDGGDPDAERMILDDLTEAYAQASENAIGTDIVAGATAGTHPITSDEPHDAIVGSIAAFPGTRFAPAEGVFLPPLAWEGLVLQKDGSGRPLVPNVGPQNAEGTVGGGGASASVLQVPVGLAWSLPATGALVARRDDAIFYESSIVTFRYEQIGGPAAIRVGVWAYLAAEVRRPAGVVLETVSAPLP